MKGGVLEDPAQPQPDDLLLMTTSLEQSPNHSELVSIEFKHGVPVALNAK